MEWKKLTEKEKKLWLEHIRFLLEESYRCVELRRQIEKRLKKISKELKIAIDLNGFNVEVKPDEC